MSNITHPFNIPKSGAFFTKELEQMCSEGALAFIDFEDGKPRCRVLTHYDHNAWINLSTLEVDHEFSPASFNGQVHPIYTVSDSKNSLLDAKDLRLDAGRIFLEPNKMPYMEFDEKEAPNLSSQEAFDYEESVSLPCALAVTDSHFTCVVNASQHDYLIGLALAKQEEFVPCSRYLDESNMSGDRVSPISGDKIVVTISRNGDNITSEIEMPESVNEDYAFIRAGILFKKIIDECVKKMPLTPPLYDMGDCTLQACIAPRSLHQRLDEVSIASCLASILDSESGLDSAKFFQEIGMDNDFIIDSHMYEMRFHGMDVLSKHVSGFYSPIAQVLAVALDTYQHFIDDFNRQKTAA